MRQVIAKIKAGGAQYSFTDGRDALHFAEVAGDHLKIPLSSNIKKETHEKGHAAKKLENPDWVVKVNNSGITHQSTGARVDPHFNNREELDLWLYGEHVAIRLPVDETKLREQTRARIEEVWDIKHKQTEPRLNS